MNRYSPSRVKTFDVCPLKFKLTYIDKIDIPEAVSSDAEFGKLFHKFAERYNGTNIRELVKLTSLYELDDTYKTYIAVAFKNYKSFYQKYSKYESKTEEDLEFQDNQLWLHGIIDKLILNEKIIFVDYKTSAAPSSDRHTFQMKFYTLLVAKFFQQPVDQVRCILYYPRCDAEEKLMFSAPEMKKFEDELKAKIKKIESNSDWKESPSYACKWCKFANTKHCSVKLEKK